MTIFIINNKPVQKKDAKISVLSSFSRGYGVFETLRTYNKNPFQTKEHIERLLASAKKINLKIKYNKTEITKMVEKISQKSPHKIQRIKIMALQDILILTSEHQKIDKTIYNGVKAATIETTRPIPEIKTISYITSYLAHEEAVLKGAFDAILINNKGEVYEGAYSNLFWFEGNTLCTRKNDVLPGITRETILKISPFKSAFKTITANKLQKMDEVFFTTSVSGIVPITKINTTIIGNGKTGKNTQQLLQLHSKLTG